MLGYCFIMWWTCFIWISFHIIRIVLCSEYSTVLCLILLWLTRFIPSVWLHWHTRTHIAESAAAAAAAMSADFKRWMRLHIRQTGKILCTMAQEATSSMMVQKNRESLIVAPLPHKTDRFSSRWRRIQQDYFNRIKYTVCLIRFGPDFSLCLFFLITKFFTSMMILTLPTYFLDNNCLIATAHTHTRTQSMQISKWNYSRNQNERNAKKLTTTKKKHLWLVHKVK